MPVADKPSSPYKGLIPYEEKDAEFFFGREGDTRLIIANLFGSPLTLLYGVSGVGKSSILRAGVAHELRARKDVLTLVYKRWEKDPLAGLKAKLAQTALAKAAAAQIKLQDPPAPTSELDVCLEQWATSLDCRLMIILDQFEDYLQYHPPNHPFADEFSTAVMRPNIPVSFLISIREDTLAKLDRFEGSIPILFNNYLRLDHLNRNAAKEAICRPIDRYNQYYNPDGPPYEIEPPLVEVVLENVQAGKTPFGQARGSILKAEERKSRFNTFLLQLVMTRLWQEETGKGSRKLRRTTLDALHGIEQIVRDHIDKVMARLTEEEKQYAANVFRFLVTPSGTKVAYSVSDLAGQEHLDPATLEQMLEKLSQGEHRLLHRVTPLTDAHEQQYEIYHDSLGPAVLDWRLRYVREQEKAEYEKRLEGERREAERQLRRKERWLKIVSAILLGMMLIFTIISVLAYIAYRSMREAERAKAETQMQQAETRKAQFTAAQLGDLVRRQDLGIKYTKAVLRFHTAPVTSAAFSPTSQFVVTASSDTNAIVWNAQTGEELALLSGHAKPLTDVAYSSDGRYVVTASEDHTARLWDSTDWKKSVEMLGHDDAVVKVAFSADSKYIVTASQDGTACIWEVGRDRSTIRLQGQGHVPVSTAEFSPNGERVVTAHGDGTAQVWDPRTGRQLLELHGHAGAINSAKFSPKTGRTIVTAGADRTARIWDANTGHLLVTLRGHEGSVNSAEFSPDEALVVTASSDRTARIWRAGTGEPLSTLHGHIDKVNSALFSHDGQRVVTASDDKTARAWSAHAQKQNLLVELEGHIGRVTTALFSPDDSLIVTAGGDQTARIFNTTDFHRFRISEATVNPVDYQGPCPNSVQLWGRVDIGEGTGTVRYRFVRSDGVTTPSKEVEVDTAQPKWVTGFMRVGNATAPISARYYLEIIEPNSMSSPSMRFKVKCGAEPEASPAPATTPVP